MTEDPREYGLTAEDLHAAADLLYPGDDPRLQQPAWTLAEAARFGRIRSRLRSMADALEHRQEPAIHHVDRRSS